jgi:signal peptidase II
VPRSSRDADPPGLQTNLTARAILFFLIAIGGSAVDLTTKQIVFQWRGYPPPFGQFNSEWWLIEPYVGVETAINTGALFGAGAGWGKWFAILSIVAAIGILVWLFGWGGAEDRWLTVALGCVMAGIVGNLYDRLGLWYEPGMPPEWSSGVRDWILLRYRTREWTWPNFNVADSLLVCGAAMLFVHAFFESRPQPEPNHQP